MAKYFGTDGIRGRTGDSLGFNISAKCGAALGAVLGRGKRVVVGKDTRESGDMIEYALASALAAKGVTVHLVGIAPTPAVAAIVRGGGFDAGIVVSASHNPPEFNGIKIFGGDGYKLSDEQEERIEKEMDFPSAEDGSGYGRIFYEPELLEHYFSLIEKLPIGDLSGLKVCLDCGHGASCSTAEKLFRYFGCEPQMVASTPQGSLINEGCGAMHPESMAKAVAETGLDAGFCFDGDADRIIAADSKGNVIDGDGLLYIAAKSLKAAGAIRGGVVGTVMSNLGLEQALQGMDTELLRTKVGDKYVIEEMLGRGCNLGGESSGHIILSDYATTGDGVLTALIAASVMAESGCKLEDALEGYIPCAQTLINIDSSEESLTLLKSAEYELLYDGLMQEFQGNLRLVVRPSGTEPYIRVMAESGDESVARKAAEILAGFLTFKEN